MVTASIIKILLPSFRDPADVSVNYDCSQEEIDSSETSSHPDFAKVVSVIFTFTRLVESAT